MDNAILISIFGLTVNIVVAMAVLASFLWRIPSKEDLRQVADQVKDVEDKADKALQQNQAIRGDITRLEDRFQGMSNQFQVMSNQLNRVEDRADSSIQQNHEIRGDIKVLSEKVERIEGFYETPQLKTS